MVDNETFEVHPLVLEYVQALAGNARSSNTVRTYVGPIAQFLNWCDAQGIDWRTVTLLSMARYKRDVETTPVRSGEFPRASSVSVTLTAVTEFLRCCAAAGHIPEEVPARLVERKWVQHETGSGRTGESGQYRHMRVDALRVRPVETAPAVLSQEQTDAASESASTVRDRFLLVLMLTVGLRIGEALGLHAEDMHFLPVSTALGCAHEGPHVHVRKRRDNTNNALAKGWRSRTVPVTGDVVGLYRDCRYERDQRLGVEDTIDYVFVNYRGRTAGAPLTYSNAYQLVRRLGALHGFRITPHMFRHTAATNWVESGVAVDVVQELLGHASMASTKVYVHPSRERMREAVENVERARRR